jgi:hypothetical protein
MCSYLVYEKVSLLGLAGILKDVLSLCYVLVTLSSVALFVRLMTQVVSCELQRSLQTKNERQSVFLFVMSGVVIL